MLHVHTLVARDKNLSGVMGASDVAMGMSSPLPLLAVASLTKAAVSGRVANCSRSLTGACAVKMERRRSI